MKTKLTDVSFPCFPDKRNAKPLIILANDKSGNGRKTQTKSKEKRTLCSCEYTSCCEDDCDSGCSESCPCATPSPSPQVHYLPVPAEPPNTPPVNQPTVNNVPINKDTVGQHPGISTGGTGYAYFPQPEPQQNFLLRIPQTPEQVQNSNLYPNQQSYLVPLNNGITNPQSSPIRYTVVNPQSNNVYPNLNGVTTGSQTMTYRPSQIINTNTLGGQGSVYAGRQTYGVQGLNTASGYNQALTNGNLMQNNGNPGSSYNQVNTIGNQQTNQGQIANNRGTGIAGNNEVTNSVQGTNAGNLAGTSGQQTTVNNVGSNTGSQGTNNELVSNTDTHGLTPNLVPSSAVRVPSSLNGNAQTSSGTGSSGTTNNVDSAVSTSQPVASNLPPPGSQKNNPFAPNRVSTSPAGLTTQTGSANQPGSTNPTSTANPQPAGQVDQSNNPFAPKTSSSTPEKNPSTTSATLTNSVGSANPQSSQPGSPGTNSNQKTNPFAPKAESSTTEKNPSTNTPGASNQVDSRTRDASTNPVTAGSDNQGGPKNMDQTVHLKAADQSGESDRHQLGSNRNESRPKHAVKISSNSSRKTVESAKNHRSRQTEYNDLAQKSNTQNQSQSGKPAHSNDTQSKGAHIRPLKKLMTKLLDKISKQETETKSKRTEKTIFKEKSGNGKDVLPVRVVHQKRQRALPKPRKTKFYQLKLSRGRKNMDRPKKAKLHRKKIAWENVWKKFAIQES